MDPYQAAVIGSIQGRLDSRRWYRAHRWARFADLEAENTAALRELLRVARMARRWERQDRARIDAWKALRDLSPLEARAADGDR